MFILPVAPAELIVLQPDRPVPAGEKAKLGTNPEPFMLRESKYGFYNTSPLYMKRFMDIGPHLDNVDSIQVGTIFEERIRKGD
ncbi:hypothetical protein [Alicyclobacillus sp. ALC3]|uniref:hypothetical protein n=1 Tax=Alicyclobacillus sp. ALC3 TaxID=2796143 RepID=UPI002379A56C|nr:hypothetical protein [Alicyclobacillus sp. ALC3]WDL98471.1 hypothetical protein JC200_07250 [Alicyclobacillus sp. ALC3]